MSRYPFAPQTMQMVEDALAAAYERGLAAGRAEDQRAETTRLRNALYLISIVEQGAGGNLTYKEMAESAMRQAKDALAYTPPSHCHSED